LSTAHTQELKTTLELCQIVSQRQQHVSDTVIFSVSEECLHITYSNTILNFLRTLQLKLHTKQCHKNTDNMI